MANITMLNKILSEEISKFDTLGMSRKYINPSIDIKDSNRFFGTMHSGTGKMTLNKVFVENADINEIRATIMHEVCHQVVGSAGHDKKWQDAVKKVMDAFKDTYTNGEFHLNPHPYSKSRAMLPHYHLPQDKIKEVSYRYEVKCDCCGQIIRRTKKSKIITNPELYSCGICNGNFVRVK